MMDTDNVFSYRINNFINFNYIINNPKLPIIKKKHCSYSNIGRQYDYTMGQNQVLKRINFLKKKFTKNKLDY